ncbi:hypothetical protein PRBEI_2000336800 [Prionailurus iriomotensis]
MRQRKSNDYLKSVTSQTIGFHSILELKAAKSEGFQEMYRLWQRGQEWRPSSLFSSWTVGKTGSNTEFSSSSKNLDEGLAKLFDEKLSTFTVEYGYPQKESLKNTEFVSSLNQEEHLAKLFEGHVSEKRNRKSFLFSRDINEQFSTEDNETLQEAVRTDTQNKDVPCVQLLDFLQRNIIIAAASVAGILVVTVLLLLVLTAYISRKKPL